MHLEWLHELSLALRLDSDVEHCVRAVSNGRDPVRTLLHSNSLVYSVVLPWALAILGDTFGFKIAISACLKALMVVYVHLVLAGPGSGANK